MKKWILAVISIGSLVACTPANAQQDPMYSLYMFNGLAVNPAYAGSRERTAITAIYRNQWTGLEGAPKTAVLSGHAPLSNEKLGLGLTLVNDRISVFNTFSLTGSYAYRIRFKNKGKLSFGINSTLNNFRANWGTLALSDENDNVFNGARSNAFSANFGAGVYYYSERFYAGVSVPHILNMSLSEHFSAEGTNMVARQWKHYFFTTGAVFDLGENTKFKPSVLCKYTKNAPFQADLSAAFLFKEAIWVGASYRTGDAITFMSEYVFSKGVRVGYAYDLTTSQLSNYTSGTHEVMIGIEFSKKETYLTPRRMSYF
jgi:type IX secretion system PorP/SprF family membrane protein